MEKKVNLSIFFNYRKYSPRIKMLLEDVFFKKMHDEKLSSSDAMQEVMKFCNDVDEIEYTDFDFDILSRYTKAERKILINSSSVQKLFDEHKDLDEEALLKNILLKQVQNVIVDEEKEYFDVTFDDILNRNGYVAPRSLADVEDENLDSQLSSVITPKIAQKSEILSELVVTNEDKRFVDMGATTEITRVQEEIKEKLETANNFSDFEPEEKKDEDNVEYPKVGILSRKFSIPNDAEEDGYNLLDCIKRNDNNISSSSFSDFVDENSFENSDDEKYVKPKKKILSSYMQNTKNGDNTEDLDNLGFEYDEKEEENKLKNNLLSNVKNRVFAFTYKIKTSIHKKSDEENEFVSDIEDDLFNDSIEDYTNEIINEDEIESSSFKDNGEIKKMPKEKSSVFFQSFKKLENDISKKLEKKIESDALEESVPSNITHINEDINYDKLPKEDKLDDKFDNIISAIMKEKQKEIEEDEMISLDEVKDNTEVVENTDDTYKDEHLSSVYDTFAEELETVESVKKRRRAKF